MAARPARRPRAPECGRHQRTLAAHSVEHERHATYRDNLAPFLISELADDHLAAHIQFTPLAQRYGRTTTYFLLTPTSWAQGATLADAPSILSGLIQLIMVNCASTPKAADSLTPSTSTAHEIRSPSPETELGDSLLFERLAA